MKDTETYLDSKSKKSFERFKSPESYKKTQERTKLNLGPDSPISHLANPRDELITQNFEKENRQTNLQSNSQKGPSKRKVQEINELFILKLVFDALNHVSPSNIYSNNLHSEKTDIFQRTKS